MLSEEEQQITKIDIRRIYDLVSKPELLAVFKLTQREQQVLELFWGKHQTLQEIGDELDLSRQSVLQIYKHAVRRILLSVRVSTRKYMEMDRLVTQLNDLRKKNELLEQELQRYAPKSYTNEELKGTADLSSLNTPVLDLDFSLRVMKCLKAGDIVTLKDLVSRTKEKLLNIRNLGQRALNDIEIELKRLGYKLKED